MLFGNVEGRGRGLFLMNQLLLIANFSLAGMMMVLWGDGRHLDPSGRAVAEGGGGGNGSPEGTLSRVIGRFNLILSKMKDNGVSFAVLLSF